MTVDAFKIFIDRVMEGNTESLEFASEPHFMDVEETELQFDHPVSVKGQAYVSDENLFLHLEASTKAKLPCSICNSLTEVEVQISDLIHTESVAEIKGKVYDFSPVVREALLLELPLKAECAGGAWPEREQVKQYFSSSQKGEYSPFEDL